MRKPKTEGPYRQPTDAEIEREVLSRREFSLAEAIGRRNSDLLKGASPVTRKRQASLRLERYLESRLLDGEGALRAVLRRRIRESEGLKRLLREHYGFRGEIRATGQVLRDQLFAMARCGSWS